MIRTLCVLAATVLTYGFSASAADTITVGFAAPINSSETAMKGDRPTASILSHVTESLVELDASFGVKPQLAESYEVSEDGKTYTFKLRQGVTFQNGSPLTSKDVVWAYEHHMRPDRNWGFFCREVLDGAGEAWLQPVEIVGMETPDDATVVFHLLSPNVLFLQFVASPACENGIYHHDSVAADGSWVKPVGTGPYQIASWEKDKVVLERFDGYKGPDAPVDGLSGAHKADVKTLVFVSFPSRADALAALREGEVDILPDAGIEAFAALKDEAAFKVESVVSNDMAVLALQTRHDPVLRDMRVRQAIEASLDREAITAAVTGGYGKALGSLIPTATRYNDAAYALAPRDLEKARALLKAAGYAGQEIRMTVANDILPEFEAAGRIAADMMKEAGLNVVLTPMGWKELETEAGTQKNQIMSYGFSGRTDPTFMFASIICQKTDHAFGMWEDTEAALWLAQSAHERDETTRAALFRKLADKMKVVVPIIPLFEMPVVAAMRADVRGYQGWAGGTARLWGVTRAD